MNGYRGCGAYIYIQQNITQPEKGMQFESAPMRQMNLEPIIQSELSQKEKNKYHIIMHIYGIQKNGADEPACRTVKETQSWRVELGTVGDAEGGMD